MFELSSPPTLFDEGAGGVCAGRDHVRLFPGAARVLSRLQSEESFRSVRVAVASSTTEPRYAATCLSQLRADPARGESVGDLVEFRQVYPGSKGRAHFPKLASESGVAYGSMLFFDDCTYGDNCAEVARACTGVTCVRTPDGLTEALFDAGLAAYARGERGVVS